MGRSFYSKMMKLHVPALAKYHKEQMYASEKKRADMKKKRAVKETLEVMGYPPYTPGSKLAYKAVKKIEKILLEKRNYKNGYGALQIYFAQNVHMHTLYDLIAMPGWPIWPKYVQRRVVREFAHQCMVQIAAAFAAMHPEFTITRGEWDDEFTEYPVICVRPNNLSFQWAEEE